MPLQGLLPLLMSPRTRGGGMGILTAASFSLTADTALALRVVLECDSSWRTQEKRISSEIPRRNASTRLGSIEISENPNLRV